MTPPHPAFLGSGASTNFLWKTHRGGPQTVPASSGGMRRLLGPPSTAWQGRHLSPLPHCARRPETPTRWDQLCPFTSERETRGKLPPAASRTLPPPPSQVPLQWWGAGGTHSCHLPVVGGETGAPASLPGGPQVGSLDVWPALLLPLLPEPATSTLCQVSGPQARGQLLLAVWQPPSLPPPLPSALGGTGCLQREEICDQRVGQDVGCGQPPEGSFLGPRESEVSGSGKAALLGSCLSSCVQAEAQVLARKSW